MNDSTRLSHSRWRSDMLKSIERSSPGFRKIFGGTVCPQPVHRKTIYRAVARGDGGRRGIGRNGNASSALTLQPSNHSFIQLFEMQQPAPRAVKWRRITPAPP